MKTPEEIAKENNLPLKAKRETAREIIQPVEPPHKPNSLDFLVQRKAKEVCGVCGKIKYDNDYLSLTEPCNDRFCPYYDTPIIINKV